MIKKDSDHSEDNSNPFGKAKPREEVLLKRKTEKNIKDQPKVVTPKKLNTLEKPQPKVDIEMELKPESN